MQYRKESVVDLRILVSKRIGNRHENLRDRVMQILALWVSEDLRVSRDPTLALGDIARVGRRSVKKLRIVVAIDVVPDSRHWVAMLDSTSFDQSPEEHFGEMGVRLLVPFGQEIGRAS